MILLGKNTSISMCKNADLALFSVKTLVLTPLIEYRVVTGNLG